MEQTWRWFGPNDVVTLRDVAQTGASGVVTALHEIPYGVVWTPEDIVERRLLIEAEPTLGLRWSVVESLPIHEDIKRGSGDLDRWFGAYRESLRNLGAAGVRTVCYNFMPILDWTRTELRAPLPAGGNALRFNAHEIAAFDCYMLERPGAEDDYDAPLLDRARAWFRASDEAAQAALLEAIMAGLPGAYDRYDVPSLRRMLDTYKDIDKAALRANLMRFLEEVVPTAEEAGIRLCIHPDDPPRSMFGLSRIVSNAEDIAFILGSVDSPANGLTLCTGSLGAGVANDLSAIARRFADRTWFAHLRNVAKEPDGSFMEADHLSGDVPMVSVVRALMEAAGRRHDAGDPHWRIPMRSDHGHELLDDVGKKTHPGYPVIGRLKGLAELRGVIAAIAEIDGLPM